MWMWEGPWQNDLQLENISFSNWETEAPDLPSVETCAGVDSNGMWYEMNCTDHSNVICERTKRKGFFILL